MTSSTSTFAFTTAAPVLLPMPRPPRPATSVTCMCAIPADEWKATSESTFDWRAFRAHLLATHRTKQAPQRPQRHHDHTSTWAHRLAMPEVGACLLASSSHEWPQSFAHLRRSVILITDVGPMGVSGLLLNRPTRFTVATHQSVLSRVGVEFTPNRVMLGGDCSTGSLAILHPFSPSQCLGATQVIPGLSHGGFNSARALVKDGVASPSDFHFYVAYVKWTSDAFHSEIRCGAWDIIACSPSLILSSPNSSMQRETLWHKLNAFVEG